MSRPGDALVAPQPVDREQHLGEAGRAVGAGHLDADHAGAGGDALVAGERIVAGDHAGDVGAVAEGVEPGERADALLEGEVRPAEDRPGLREVADRDHAGVEHGDVHAGAVEGRLAAAGRLLDREADSLAVSLPEVLETCIAASRLSVFTGPEASRRATALLGTEAVKPGRIPKRWPTAPPRRSVTRTAASTRPDVGDHHDVDRSRDLRRRLGARGGRDGQRGREGGGCRKAALGTTASVPADPEPDPCSLRPINARLHARADPFLGPRRHRRPLPVIPVCAGPTSAICRELLPGHRPVLRETLQE